MDGWERSVARRIAGAERARAVGRHQPGVYLVTGAALVKIGYVSASYTGGIKRRLASMQGGSPVPLTLHRFIPFGRPAALERVLHARFAAMHSHGEWFAAAVLAELEPLSDDEIIAMVHSRTVASVSDASADPRKPQ